MIMGQFKSFRQLADNDRRRQWKLLKTKHKTAIAAAKLDLDLKFGTALDKHQARIEKLNTLSKKRELRDADLQPVFESATAMKPTVTAYRAKVKTLPDPAKKELNAFLKSIDEDRQGWEQLVLSLSSNAGVKPTPEQQAAAQPLVVTLDSLRQQCLTLATRGKRATAAFLAAKPPRPGAAAKASAVTEAARLAGPNAYEVATAADQVLRGSNYELFKKRAQAIAPLLKRLRKATDEFSAAYAIHADSKLENITKLATDTDVSAIKGNFEQTISLCDYALDCISKLP
jgi:hypothetical protein